MKESKKRRTHGFTLIELMIALVITSMVVAGTFYYFTTQEKAFIVQEQITEMQQNARGGIDFISRELRMIGYGVTSGAIITEADSNAITFLGDIDGDGSPETIRYALDATNLQLTREVDFGGAVEVAENITSTGLVFQYFNNNDNDLSTTDPLPLNATNRTNIRRINVSVTARTDNPDPDYSANNGYRTISYTTNIRPRNLGLISMSGCSVPATPTIDGTATTGLNNTFPCQLNVEWAQVTTDINGVTLAGSCALTQYEVSYGTSSGTYGTTLVISPSLTATTFSVAPGCTYYATVRAVNSSGDGAQAAEDTITDTTGPGTPSGLALTPLDNEIDLSWDVPTSNSCDISGYNIYRSTTSGSYSSPLTSTSSSQTSYEDTSVTNCTTYYYRVTAIDNCGNTSGFSNEATDSTGSSPPKKPTNVVATVNNNNDIQIRWDPPVNNADDTVFISGDPDGYNVYRDTNYTFPSPVQVNTGLVNSSPYNDNSMSDATSTIYYYKVTAVDQCGNESEYSDYAAPAALTVTFEAGYPYKSSGQRKVRVEVYVKDQYNQAVTDATVTVTVTGTDPGNTTPENGTLLHNGGGIYGSGTTPKTYWEGSIRYNSTETVTVQVTATKSTYSDGTVSTTFN
ncbi:MAG: prepilin-type N-terminal cleavage/methylation domain-containing protein [Thermodesulfobacteriota bacterium]|nr:prepilin-type N-terminal cleavage/methylation domain-containing protein [Thermodesulfobacteriota bacterium]